MNAATSEATPEPDAGATAGRRIDFRTTPARYRHWRLDVTPPVARLVLDVDEAGGLSSDYLLKLNSYDLSVDIELADAVQRLRFEHPEVRAVAIVSGKPNTFCAGANIRMLAGASHGHKVNFCKFTNETRNAIEDASAHSGQRYLAALNGAAAGGGYELALAAERILLVDDGNAAVSLPEVPLLGVLPGTGGLTRLVDKRGVRRDVADRFCTLEEGIRGTRAVEARLVDEAVPRTRFEARLGELLAELAGPEPARGVEQGIVLEPIERTIEAHAIRYRHVDVTLDRRRGCATLAVRGPTAPPPPDPAGVHAQGSRFWLLDMLRELDDALLELRFNEPACSVLVLKTTGNAQYVAGHDALLDAFPRDRLLREVTLLGQRVLKRLDLTSRSLLAVIEPGSCFAGTLAELALAADQTLMKDGDEATHLLLGPANFGRYRMVNGLTRLATRFLHDPPALAAATALLGTAIDARAAAAAGLVTAAVDELDWEDELRLLVEARAGMSGDALTGMEANLRFAGPETMESKIFARLSAWQNWIFQRPNATGERGALPSYGTGRRPDFDRNRI